MQVTSNKKASGIHRKINILIRTFTDPTYISSIFICHPCIILYLFFGLFGFFFCWHFFFGGGGRVVAMIFLGTGHLFTGEGRSLN